jgi:putative ATP-dependent DNA ligase
MNFIAEALNLPPSSARRLEERNIVRPALINHPFFPDILEAYCLGKKFGEFEEGILVVRTENASIIVRGYPKIRRALTLYPTVKRRFKGDVVIEEKMNGYNVRIVNFGENIYAVTRRGFICPYTTEKARESFNPDFFKGFPEFMLCCEAVGEESPFVPKKIYGIKGIDFFVFDIRDMRTNIALPLNIKMSLSEEYGFKIAPVLSETEAEKAHEKIKSIILELGARGREGVVIKDPQMKVEPLKYTSSQSNCGDLNYAFRYFNEYAKDFMLSRIVREAFQSFEFEEDEEELRKRCLRLGEAILIPIIRSIEDVSKGNKVVEEHRLKFRNLEVLELFKEHLRRMGIDANYSEPEIEDGYHILKFERYMKSTADKISHLVKGNVW